MQELDQLHLGTVCVCVCVLGCLLKRTVDKNGSLTIM